MTSKTSDVATPPAAIGIGRPARAWLAGLLVVGAVLLALAPVCRSDFSTWDDSYTVRDNPTLNPVTWDSVRTWWTVPFMDLYVPLTYTAWGIIALVARVPAAAGVPAHLSPIPFHTANLLLHVLSVLVVFQIVRLLTGGRITPSPGTPGEGRGGGEHLAKAGESAGRTGTPTLTLPRSTRGGERARTSIWPAAAGALVFGLHPVQVEAVAWISGLKDVLGGLLSLCAVWLYLLSVRGNIRAGVYDSGLRSRRRRPHWQYTAATTLYALAMLAKPAAVIAPLIAMVLDCVMLGAAWKAALRRLWPWLLLAVAGGVEAFVIQGVHVDRNNVAVYFRPMVAVDSLAFYLGTIFWPAHLGIDYGLRPAVMLRDPWLVLKCLLLAGAGVVLWLCRRRNDRPMAAAAMIFVAALLPVLGLITFDFQSYSNVADHYLYLAMLGPALAAAWAFSRWERWPMFAGTALALAALGWTSNRQVRYWKDGPALVYHEMTVNPESPIIYRAMAVYALADKDYVSAKTYAEHALRLDPDDPGAHIALGDVLWHDKQKELAVAQYQAGLRIRPDDVDGLVGMATAMVELGRFGDAEWYIRRQLEQEPESAAGHYRLGLILFQEHRLGESIGELRAAVNREPRSAQFRIGLAKELEATGEPGPAWAQFQSAAQIDPNSADARDGVRRLAGKH